MLFFGVLLLSAVFCLAEDCNTNPDFSTTCSIGGLVITQPEHNIEVKDDNCDSVYEKEKFANSPKVFYPKAVKDEVYTLVMVDPDAPNHPKGQYFLHWIVANIPGENLITGDISAATVLADYIGPAPPKDTGLHRYMFVLFRHEDAKVRLTKTIAGGRQGRRNFNLAEWLSTTKKEEGALCGPIAGIQFRAQFAAEV